MKLVLSDSAYLLTIAIISLAVITTDCKSKSERQQSPNTSQQNPAQQLSIDDLVAPIALYPDQLLAQVLTTSVDSQEVLDLGNWLLQHQNLQSDAMTSAAKAAGFSPSAQYLALFPQVVDNMCQQLDWTRQLGEAFKADQKGVMDAVQRKRAQAQQLGNLNSSEQMAVDTKRTDDGKSYVEIKPADPKVVYVPQYNPVTIYNTTAPAAPAQTTTTTTEKEKSGVSGGEAAAIGLLSFGIGMAVGSAINNDNYYPYPAWGYHSVYVAGRPYYPAAYRPPVYAGYRPAYGYHAPANYRWNQYNRNVNATINNNYYNRFNNQNANVTGANRARGYNQNRAANARLQNQPNWRGQTTYQGARSTSTQAQRAGASMANAVPRNQQYGQRSQVAANRPNASSSNSSSIAANRAARSDFNRSTASTPTASLQQGQGNFDRGYSGSSATRSADSAPSRLQSGGSGGAFGGAREDGRQARAASDRGRASMGSRGGGRRR